MNQVDFDSLITIFRRLGVRKGFYGSLKFIFQDGVFVHYDWQSTLKPDGLKQLLDKTPLANSPKQEY
jgi:hypothetical protein